MPLKIAFFGLPLAALLLAADGHDVVSAAICRRDAAGLRRLRRRIGDGRVRVMPKLTTKSADDVRASGAELVVSWFWTKKLPIEIVRAAPLGGIGVHPSLLPRWRGPDPTFWAIDVGDVVTGVTAHRIEAEYDTGAMLGAREVAIDPRWDSWALARALDRPSLALLREVVAAFARGEPPREIAQDERLVTLAPQPSDDELALDFSWPAERVLRRIRAAAPYPGAWTFIGDDAVVITRASLASSSPKALLPGEAAVIDDHVLIRCSDGALDVFAGRLVPDEGEDLELSRADLVSLVRRATLP